MSATSRTITIPHLGRVEGHGGIFVKLVGRRVQEVNMDIHEGSRYYEALLVGKHFLDVQGIITRVCAICSANHTVAALTALENALGVPQSAARLRCCAGLLLLGAAIESHALHVFALALPDFLGYDSVIAMAAKYPGEVAFALKLKQLGNRDPGARRRPRRASRQHPGRRLRQAAAPPRARGAPRRELAQPPSIR